MPIEQDAVQVLREASVARLAADWRRQHPTSDFPDRRVTVTCGGFRIALRLGDDRRFDSRRWLDPPGLAAQITLDVTIDERSPDLDRRPVLVRGAAAGFAFDGNYAQIVVDDSGAIGSLRLAGRGGDDWLLGLGLREGFLAVFQQVVASRGGARLHAATLALDGLAWVVFGASGAGKTTLAWRFIDSYVQDDWVFLVPDAQGIWWAWRLSEQRGPFDPDEPAWQLRLGGLRQLSPERRVTGLRPLSPEAGFAALSASAHAVDGCAGPGLLDALARLVEAHPPALLDHALTTPADELAAFITGTPAG